MTIYYVPLNRIFDNRYQRRSEYGDVAELAADIDRHAGARPDTKGLLQIPAGRLVTAEREVLSADGHLGGAAWLDDGHCVELQFGHRRLRAFKLLEKENPSYGAMPVQILDLSDQDLLDGVWTENRARRDLSAVEEAELLQLKLDTLDSQRELAEAWGLARSTVANRLRLLQFPHELQAANRRGELSERQLLALDSVVRLAEMEREAGKPLGNWKSQKEPWNPEGPAAYIEEVLEERPSSDEIRDQAAHRLNYAGAPLPDSIATISVAKPDVVQSTCKGCSWRLNQHCMNKKCLAIKKAAYAADAVAIAATELGLPISEDTEDFEHMRDRHAIERIVEAGACEHLVIGWHTFGSSPRPFTDIWYVSEGDAYDKRAGVAYGHRGPVLSSCLPDAEADEEPEDHRPPRAKRQRWQESAQRQKDEMKARLRDVFIERVYAMNGDLWPLFLLNAGLNTEQPDGEKMAKSLVAALLDRGRALTYDNTHHAVSFVETGRLLLQRIGADPASIEADNPVRAAKEEAERVLDRWWWTDYTPEGLADQCAPLVLGAMERVQAVLDEPAGMHTAELMQLLDDLEQCREDIERVQTEKEE